MMRGLALIAVTIAAAVALHTDGKKLRADTGDIPYPCFETLLQFCAGTGGANCTACAGRHQWQLQRFCRPTDVQTACADNLLRQFSIALDNDGLNDNARDFTYQLVTYGNASNPGNLQPLPPSLPSRPGRPGRLNTICFDASDDPDSNYFLLGTHAVWDSGGRVRVDQSMLQFRLTDINDPAGAVTLNTAWWDNINASNMTQCDASHGTGCAAVGPAVTTQIVQPRSQTDVGGGWQVYYNGLCGQHHGGPDDKDDDDDADDADQLL